MTQDEIIRMALEVGVKEHGPLTRNWSFRLSQLERFSNLAFAAGAAHEREACAKVCEDLYKHLNHDADCRKLWPRTKMINDQYAAAIRARTT